MQNLAIKRKFEFKSTDSNQYNTPDTKKEAAMQKWNIEIIPTRLKFIKVRIKADTPIERSPSNSLRIYFFKDLAGGLQSELIYLDEFSKQRELDYTSNEGHFWSGNPFIVTSIGFCPENLDADVSFSVEIIKR